MYSFCTSSGKRQWKTWQFGDTNYGKIPKISPGAYILQTPLWRGLFLEGLIFGGVYVRREIFVSKSIGLACSGKEICHFCFVLRCIWGQIPSTSPPGGLYSEGRFNGGFFELQVWPIFGGAYTWGGLFSEFYGVSASAIRKQVSRCYIHFPHELTWVSNFDQSEHKNSTKSVTNAWPWQEKSKATAFPACKSRLNFRVRGQFEIKILMVQLMNITYFTCI